MTKLVLPKTKLVYEDGKLVKYGNNDAVLAAFPKHSVNAVRLESTREYALGVLFGPTFVALAAVSKLYITSPGWSWVSVIVCLALAGFSVLMIFGQKIVIETNNGTVGYPNADQPEEAEGFVVAMNHAIEDHEDSAEESSI